MQTSSAPVHNMFAEQTLGLADHYLRRARNCTIGHIKVKCRKNDTLTWLVAKPSDEQEKIIQFSIAEAKTMRAQLKKREDNIAKIQAQLVIEKKAKKRFKLQKEAGKKAEFSTY